MGIRKTVEEIRNRKELWWMQAIDEYFKKQNGVSVPVGVFRPSGISPCMRENQYCYAGFAKYPPHHPIAVKSMKRGTEHHKIWEQIFIDAGMNVLSGKDFPLSHEHPLVRGTPDWLVRHESEIYLFEWKSTANTLDPDWGQLVQWSTYAYLLNDCYGIGVNKGWIVKENPINFGLHPIPMLLEEDFVKDLFVNLKIVETSCDSMEMIRRDDRCGPGGEWKISCPLYSYCHSEKGDNPWKVKKAS